MNDLPIHLTLQAANTSDAWNIWDFVIIGGLLIGGFLVIIIVKSLIRQDVKGSEFTSYGLKGMYDKGLITEEEYKVVREKMARRVQQQIEEEDRRRSEGQRSTGLSAEQRLVTEMELTDGGAGKQTPISPDEPPVEVSLDLTSDAPLSDDEIARLQQQELEIKRRLDAARGGKAKSG